MSTDSVKVARIYQSKDDVTEKAIQEIATQMQNNLQYGTETPASSTQGKVYFQIGTPDATTGWAEVSKIYIQTKS